MSRLEKLEWDSNFFGYPVAKVIIDNKETIEWEKLKSYKLTYIFGHLPHTIGQNNLILVDKKVVLERNLTLFEDEKQENIGLFENKTHNFEDLLNLGYRAGIHSRFKKDHNFKNNEFKKLYREWVNKSLSDESTYVLVHTNGSIINGFLTLEYKEAFAEIGLIAVSSNCSGKGIGSNLLKSAFSLSSKEYSHIRVSTQKDNLGALKLYEKNNFKIIQTTPIYHYWNL